MGSKQSVLTNNGYSLVSEQDNKIVVKNKFGDQFVIKKLNDNQDNVSQFLQKLNHPHIVEHKEIIPDRRCLYLVMELCEGDLPEIIKIKKEATEKIGTQGDQTEGINRVNQQWTEQVLDWTVKLCMALKHLHDQQILHKNLQPKNIFFTACGTIRLGEFGRIHEWSTDTQTAEALSYVAPEILNGESYDEKSEIWSLGCIIYEMCMLKCAFVGKSTVDIIPKILRSSYEALPVNFSQDLRQLVTDTLQTKPANRPSVSEILMRPFIIKHLYEKSTQTIKELNVRKTYEDRQETPNEPESQETPNESERQEKTNESKVNLKVLEELADGLERVHFNTTVGSLTGGVVGLTGGITSIVGLILTPFTLGASLIVTGVGIGVAVAGGVTAGVSNVTKMVNQRSNRQKIKMLITELKEKITSTSCCVQNIQIAVELQQREISRSNQSWSNAQSGADAWASAGARLGRGLGGISELVRITEVASVGKVAAQTARAVRVAEAATGVLSGLFVAVDIFFIALDSREIHKLRKDYAAMAIQKESSNAESESSQTADSEPNNNEQELQSEIMIFVKKIRVTVEELNKNLNELKNELEELSTLIPNTNN